MLHSCIDVRGCLLPLLFLLTSVFDIHRVYFPWTVCERLAHSVKVIYMLNIIGCAAPTALGIQDGGSIDIKQITAAPIAHNCETKHIRPPSCKCFSTCSDIHVRGL